MDDNKKKALLILAQGAPIIKKEDDEEDEGVSPPVDIEGVVQNTYPKPVEDSDDIPVSMPNSILGPNKKEDILKLLKALSNVRGMV